MYIRSDRLHEIKSVARSHQVTGTEVQLIVLCFVNQAKYVWCIGVL